MKPTAQKTHWRTILRRANPDLIYAEDIKDKAPLVVEIVNSGDRVTLINASGKKDVPWIAFKGGKKRLGCSTTLCKQLETIFHSPYHQDWRGPITLVVIRTAITDQKTKERYEQDSIRIAPAQRGSRPVDAGAHELPAPPEPEGLTPDEAAEIAAMEREAGR